MLAFKQTLVNRQKHQKVDPKVGQIPQKIDQALQRKSGKNLRLKRTLKISLINKRFVPIFFIIKHRFQHNSQMQNATRWPHSYTTKYFRVSK